MLKRRYWLIFARRSIDRIHFCLGMADVKKKAGIAWKGPTRGSFFYRLWYDLQEPIFSGTLLCFSSLVSRDLDSLVLSYMLLYPESRKMHKSTTKKHPLLKYAVGNIRTKVGKHQMSPVCFFACFPMLSYIFLCRTLLSEHVWFVYLLSMFLDFPMCSYLCFLIFSVTQFQELICSYVIFSHMILSCVSDVFLVLRQCSPPAPFQGIRDWLISQIS